MPESITITDNRTGESVEVPIQDGGIDSAEWAKLMPGLWFKDEGLATTAMTNSAITYIDGNAGVLEYRGYPIEQLAEQSTFLEVAYLLVHGELPTQEQLDAWVHEITTHTFIHENFRKRMVDAFHYDAHPMGMLTSGMAALSTFYPEAKDIEDPANRMEQIVRVIAKIPTLAAGAYRKSLGMPFIYPDNDLSYTENFLSMMFRIAEPQFAADPVLARALDILFILHADHEQNCSTTATRVVGSSHADPYSAVAAGCAALYGPRHGGANEAVLAMLDEIGTFDNVDAFVESVKNGEGRLMGFGHRVYKNFDPRAKVMQATAKEVLDLLGTGDNEILKVAQALEKVALEDEYFIEKKLYPNVDFYSGVILSAIGFPTTMFTVLFALARTVGWVAQWNEMISDPGQKIGRPRQLYTGPTQRDYIPVENR